jgi:RimJ/RimL family protein N-acetyltransferase
MAKDFRQPEELTTERLVLRKSVDERDLDRYLTDLKKTNEFYFQFGMECSDELIGNISLEFEQVLYFTVFLKDTDIMVGYVGITPQSGFAEGEIEGYIFEKFRRNHYASEAFNALIEWYSGIQSDTNKPKNIYGRVVPENEPCNQLMLKLGFSKAATGFCFGSLCVILYELNKGQFWQEDEPESSVIIETVPAEQLQCVNE